METQFLRELGLSEKAAQIYLALLKLGTSQANKVAKETKINRTTTYDILNELIKKGFSSYVIKETKKFFSATSPDKILELLKEKELNLKEKISELKQLQKQKTEEVSVEVYTGKEGLKTVIEDILKVNENFMLLGWKGKIYDYLKFTYPHLDKRRIKQRIRYRALVNHENKDSIKKEKLVKFKILPEKMSFPSTMIVYGNKIIIVVSLEEETTVILIESKKLTETYKNYFEVMWKLL